MKKKILINQNETIFSAMKLMNATGQICLIVIDNLNKFKGVITDGDIRRSLLKQNDLKKKIIQITNKKPLYHKKNLKISNKIKNFISRNKHLIVPIINNKNIPVDYISYNENLTRNESEFEQNKILIMAGGVGTRMKPFTNILPKPLVPYKNKPMILNIMDGFKKYNFNNFIISINKKEKILNVFLNQFKNSYNFEYLKESSPLGTAGCLKQINFKEDFFLINCDTYLRINLQNLLKFHKNTNSLITLVAGIKYFDVSFGECILDNSGNLKKILEKPKKSFLSNTGLYVLKPEVKKYLPNKIKFDMNELISRIIKQKKKITVFPIANNDWKDTGSWTNYLNEIKSKN